MLLQRFPFSPLGPTFGLNNYSRHKIMNSRGSAEFMIFRRRGEKLQGHPTQEGDDRKPPNQDNLSVVLLALAIPLNLHCNAEFTILHVFLGGDTRPKVLTLISSRGHQVVEARCKIR